MNIIDIERILEATTLDQIKSISTLVSDNEIINALEKGLNRTNSSVKEVSKNYALYNSADEDENEDDAEDENKNKKRRKKWSKNKKDFVPLTKELSTITIDGSFNDLLQVKKFVIAYIFDKEELADKLETLKNLEKTFLYEVIFGMKFSTNEFLKKIELSLNYNALFKKPVLQTSIFGKNISEGLYAVLGIPKSGKQVIQLYIIDYFIKAGFNCLNICIGERPDTLTSIYYEDYFIPHSLVLQERVLPSSLINLLQIIANTPSDIIYINSINSLVDNMNSGVLSKGGMDKNAIELVSKLIHYVGLMYNKIIFATYRLQISDIETNFKSVFSGITNGVVALPFERAFSVYAAKLEFDNRTPGQVDSDEKIENLSYYRDMLDPKLRRLK